MLYFAPANKDICLRSSEVADKFFEKYFKKFWRIKKMFYLCNRFRL